jgi:hypothetical protein
MPYPVEGNEWQISCYSADASGGEDLKAAETGKCHYLRKIKIYAQSVTDITVTIGAGQGTDVTTTYLGPIPLSDTGGFFELDLGKNSLKVASATALSIDTSAACPIFVWAEGKTSALA